MALIFLNVLTNIVSDAGQYRCVVNWGAIIDEAHMSEPELGNCNYEDSGWFDSFKLAVPNIGKIQKPKSLFYIVDRCRWPEELKDDTLPNSLFGWTVKKEMARGVFNRQADRTQR